jgi:hypothetical protein
LSKGLHGSSLVVVPIRPHASFHFAPFLSSLLHHLTLHPPAFDDPHRSFKQTHTFSAHKMVARSVALRSLRVSTAPSHSTDDTRQQWRPGYSSKDANWRLAKKSSACAKERKKRWKLTFLGSWIDGRHTRSRHTAGGSRRQQSTVRLQAAFGCSSCIAMRVQCSIRIDHKVWGKPTGWLRDTLQRITLPSERCGVA